MKACQGGCETREKKTTKEYRVSVVRCELDGVKDRKAVDGAWGPLIEYETRASIALLL